MSDVALIICLYSVFVASLDLTCSVTDGPLPSADREPLVWFAPLTTAFSWFYIMGLGPSVLSDCIFSDDLFAVNKALCIGHIECEMLSVWV